MRFYLGTHMTSPTWWEQGVPLFVSRRRLARRKSLPEPRAPWALDSGGFTELHDYGRWTITEDDYVAEVERYRQMGHLDWVAPMDWMCEPFILERTGLTVADHQARTVENFLRLRDRLGELVVPVLQGWRLDDYLRCADLYAAADVALDDEPVVGLGTVCRRQNMEEAEVIVRALARLDIALHGFGVKSTGLQAYADALTSADSMAWSYNGRRNHGRCPNGCVSCANCLHHALSWRDSLLAGLDDPEPHQLPMEVSL